jgi:HSP20 family protein
MKSVVKSNSPLPRPFSGLVENMFGESLNRVFRDDLWTPLGSQLTTVPVNLSEHDESFELELVAPGLKKEDFRLQVQDDTLTVSFEHKEESTQQEGKRILRREYQHQSFSRRFALNGAVDSSAINAKYVDGLLRVTLPKKPEVKKLTQQIPVE